MTSLNHTPNYGLTQYAANGRDSISFIGDYNSDMKIIDMKMKSLDDKISQIIDMLNGLKEEQNA